MSVLQGTLFLTGLMSAAWTDLRHRQIYDLSSIIIAGAGLISFSPAHLLGLLLSVPFLLGVLRGGAGLVLALLLYCLFYLAVAIERTLRGAERPPESYPLAPFLAVGFITAYII